MGTCLNYVNSDLLDRFWWYFKMLLKEFLPKAQHSKDGYIVQWKTWVQVVHCKIGTSSNASFLDICPQWTWTFNIDGFLASRLGGCSYCCALSKKKWNSQHFHRRRACNVPSENLWNGIKAMTIYVTITAAAAGPKNVKSIFFFTRKGHKSRGPSWWLRDRIW